MYNFYHQQQPHSQLYAYYPKIYLTVNPPLPLDVSLETRPYSIPKKKNPSETANAKRGKRFRDHKKEIELEVEQWMRKYRLWYNKTGHAQIQLIHQLQSFNNSLVYQNQELLVLYTNLQASNVAPAAELAELREKVKTDSKTLQEYIDLARKWFYGMVHQLEEANVEPAVVQFIDRSFQQHILVKHN